MDDDVRRSAARKMSLRIASKLQWPTNAVAPPVSVSNTSRLTRGILFMLFFVSGFSGLIYQVVWVRLGFASFGIIAPVLSVILSVFMLGLALGAWAGGLSINFLVRKSGRSGLWFYSGTEIAIGVGAFAVPALFRLVQQLLLSADEADSARYLCLSALALSLSILPWCILMGATFPFMMAFVREENPGNSDSFSFLYVANVLGAMSGSFLSAIVLVELLGLRATLCVAAAGNFSVGIIAALLALRCGANHTLAVQPSEISMPIDRTARHEFSKWFTLSLLFLTGFAALGMEVVWTRAFTTVLKTQVYSFALILFAYLGATFVGSSLYRRDLSRSSVRSVAVLLSVLSMAALLPSVLSDLRLFMSASYTMASWSRAVVLLSICPFCAALGYLTPKLIDSYGSGDPAEAGRAYAVNVSGCILGPLFASYIVLPWLGERLGLVALGVPFVLLFVRTAKSVRPCYRWATGTISTALIVWSSLYSVDFARFVSSKFEGTEIRRDYAASVVSSGRGLNKRLFVNGLSMTSLVPATKFMAHLPLALHNGRPESVLIICFGMGTTYRSALSWNVQTTAVELVPSVKQAFGFYHADAPQVLSNPKGHIIVDDGRRYLNRTHEQFDVIVIDPPPPVEAAGSSLLYSEEFYALTKAHLKQNGILSTWVPADASADSCAAILRSVVSSFQFVRCFLSIDAMGMHMLASQEAIENISATQFASRMPAAAAIDLLEWDHSVTLTDYIRAALSNEMPTEATLNPEARVRITDDHPYNEYFLLRRHGNFFAFH
jgi:spermidine synthase